MRPVLIEIVTRMMTTLRSCRHCNILFDDAGLNQRVGEKDMEAYPSDLLEEGEKLSRWMAELKRLYRHRLVISLVDVRSFTGFYKSLRFRIRTYPTFIVEGKETYTGWDKTQLERLLDRYVNASLSVRRQPA
ncbi:MAG: hypothetical protein A2170_13395 [Deltaproteobacteria bacterium RBG_13_53_10]|nr:MAG: hypothetical protein A2170_13395 [Deltaproteobacteria bacterium RBG_13_53_10]